MGATREREDEKEGEGEREGAEPLKNCFLA